MSSININETVGKVPNNASGQIGEHRSTAAIVLSAMVLSIICLLAIFGNLIVIIAIRQTKSLRSELSNLFLINLSITDLSSALLVMISALVALTTDRWPLGDIWCNVVCICNYCLIIVSMLTLCCISLDRWYAVARPLHYLTKVTRARVCTVIAYTWFQGIVFAVVPVTLDWVRFDYWEVICAIQWHVEHKKAVYYVSTACIVCFLLPGVLLVISYSRIARRTKRYKRRSSSIISGVIRQESHGERTAKMIRSLLVVIVAYFICMTPFSLTKFLKVLKPDPLFVPGYVNLTAAWIGYLSSAINPFIYGIFRKDFRMAFRRTLRRFFCPHKPLDVSINMSNIVTSLAVKH